MKVRINKFMARSGITSRRGADRLIAQGRVTVNDQIVQELGLKIDDRGDKVELDGKKILPIKKPEYILLNKPLGYLVTRKDPYYRKTVMELLPVDKSSLFPVGRLDFDSEGLLLFTNDGELAHRLMHPSFKVKKEYLIRIADRPGVAEIKSLEKGIYLDNKKTAPAKIKLLRENQKTTIFSIEIHEGRKREIRRMFKAIGYPVLLLKRIKLAGLTIGKLKSGRWRHLTPPEIDRLKKLVGLD